ncbi:hypothetical protein ACFUJU_06305 [Streptomyces sp. NPDC057235]|uniref:hypothetical protein n=1 Tax=Streptomyces sp. NPDC057235 TaxID=3346058 RepID=UPI00362F0974
MQTTLSHGAGPVAAAVRPIGFRYEEGAHDLVPDGLHPGPHNPADAPEKRSLTGLGHRGHERVPNAPGARDPTDRTAPQLHAHADEAPTARSARLTVAYRKGRYRAVDRTKEV